MLKKDWNYRRGDIYLVDLGEHRGNIQGGVRPVINIQNNSGNLFGPTLIVVPLTTELKKLGFSHSKLLKLVVDENCSSSSF